MAEEVDSSFKCVKITLIVVYILSIVGALFLVITFSIGAAAISQSKDRSDDQATTQAVLMVGILVGFLSLVTSIIGLFGVIKENKCIMITMLVFGILGIIANLANGSILSAVIALIIVILTAIFISKLRPKDDNININNSKV